MTDMTVALRVFADTEAARTGLRTLAEGLRDMGVRAKVAAVDSTEAAGRAGAAWTASGTQIRAAMSALEIGLESGDANTVAAITREFDLASDASLSAAAAAAEHAAQLAELRAALNPMAAAAQAVGDGFAKVAVAEELGAISAREAAVLTDRLTRSLIEIERAAEAAGLPLRDLGPASQQGATGIQQLIEAQTGIAGSATSSIAALLQQGQALDDLRARYSPVYAEARRLVTEIAAVEDAERQGAISAREAALALDQLDTALSAVRAQAAQAGVSLDSLALPARSAATAMQQLIEAQTGVTRASEGAIAAELRHGQTLNELKARFNPIFAATQQYEQELRDIAEAERLGAISAMEAAAARERAAASMAPVANGLRGVGASAGAASAYVANLGYQFNDIAMMLAAGQNPLMLAMQQGTQVTQVFQQMRASGMGLAAGLRTALMGMVSPLSLITMGAIAGGAALLQWAMSGVEATVSLDDAMGELASAMSDYEQSARAAASPTDELRQKFGTATGAARELLKEMEAIDARRALDAVGTVFRSAVDQQGIKLAGAASGAGADLHTMSDLFGLDPKLAAQRDAVYGVRNAMVDFDSARFDPDPDRRLDRMAEAASVMVERTREAIDLDGRRSKAEDQLLDTLIEQNLALQRQRQLRDEAARAAALRAQAGEDRATRATRPEPLSGEAFQKSFAERADLDRQAAMAALVVQHGKDSLEVARAQVTEERRLYEIQLQKEAISDTERRRRLEAWDLVKGLPALESQRRAEAEKLLATLQQEAALQQAIRTYGEDSAEVARLRADQERAAFEATVATLVPAGDLRDRLMEAWENGRGLAATDMASGIDAAAKRARDLANDLGISLATAARLAALGPQGTLSERPDPSGQVYSGRGAAIPTAADIAWMGAGGIDPEMAKRLANLGKTAKTGGGAGAKDTLAGLSKEAAQLMRDVEIASASVSEKVKVGLLSVAEGETQMAQAKERAAGQLADLIARLDRLGPAGKAAADAARGALQELAEEAGRTDSKIRDGMIKSFEDNFVRSLVTGKDAMTSFADHVQTELARAFTQKFVTPMISPLIDGIMGIFGGVASAKGNVFANGRLVPFAKGGTPGLPELGAYSNSIVTRPTAFGIGNQDVGIMGEAGAEAILPLLSAMGGHGVRATGPDGSTTVLPLRRAADGALGVQLPDVAEVVRRPAFFADGGVIGRLSDPPKMGEVAAAGGGVGGRSTNINIVNNHPSAKVTAQERPGSDGMSIDVMVEQLESALADRARRGVGSLSGVLGDTFGLGRVGR